MQILVLYGMNNSDCQWILLQCGIKYDLKNIYSIGPWLSSAKLQHFIAFRQRQKFDYG